MFIKLFKNDRQSKENYAKATFRSGIIELNFLDLRVKLDGEGDAWLKNVIFSYFLHLVSCIIFCLRYSNSFTKSIEAKYELTGKLLTILTDAYNNKFVYLAWLKMSLSWRRQSEFILETKKYAGSDRKNRCGISIQIILLKPIKQQIYL